jgi:hypothetical protein
MEQILCQFSEQLTDERQYESFQQDSTTVNTARKKQGLFEGSIWGQNY